MSETKKCEYEKACWTPNAYCHRPATRVLPKRDDGTVLYPGGVHLCQRHYCFEVIYWRKWIGPVADYPKLTLDDIKALTPEDIAFIGGDKGGWGINVFEWVKNQ